MDADALRSCRPRTGVTPVLGLVPTRMSLRRQTRYRLIPGKRPVMQFRVPYRPVVPRLASPSTACHVPRAATAARLVQSSVRSVPPVCTALLLLLYHSHPVLPSPPQRSATSRALQTRPPALCTLQAPALFCPAQPLVTSASRGLTPSLLVSITATCAEPAPTGRSSAPAHDRRAARAPPERFQKMDLWCARDVL